MEKVSRLIFNVKSRANKFLNNERVKKCIKVGEVVVGIVFAWQVYENLKGNVDNKTKNDSLTKYDYISTDWLENASEDEMRATSDEMCEDLNRLNYESAEHTRISNIYVDVVNAICSRFPLNIPHREHGRYLPNDD